ncbi:tetratricopeptide repeat protein 25 [Caerostris extrusa]|uniref:Outer dynein arm-docking complex subunit 4 n=1 Tax=Caerostris extrusa TaxID=172846 RepID=A0AAV4VG52_CAEEX|nr:tetratricopeptide repeat protein 25 [Caerostris extrusa]
MFITEGMGYLKLRLFNKAMQCFNTALEREPTNEASLIGRAKCYMNQGLYLEAKEDAEAVLKVHPKSPMAKVIKAEIEYFLGDFERSFLTYAQAYNARPNYDAFRLGFQVCENSIENALKPREGLHLDENDIEGIEKLLGGGPSKDADIKEPDSSKKCNVYEDDIKFLNDRLSDKFIEFLHPQCKDLKEFLEGRQEFWNYEKPKVTKRR